MKITTTNVNGYRHTLSKKKFNTRLEEIFEHFTYDNALPDVWGMQESASGGVELPCVEKLETLAADNDYTLIMPHPDKWYPKANPKSFYTALLLKDVQDVEQLKLEDRIEVFGRYNYVRVVFKNSPEEFHILNIHAPQDELFPGRKADDPYVEARKNLAETFFDVLTSKIESLLADGKTVIVLGDFNKALKDEVVQKLLGLGLTATSDGMMRTNYGPIAAMSIDHILVSENLSDRVGSAVIDQDISRVDKLTDHASVSVTLG